MDRDPRLEIIIETLRQPAPGTAPADLISGAHISRFDPSVNVGQAPAPWAMQVDILAQKIFTALFGRPRTTEQRSPRAQAEDAKRDRDLVGEMGTLMAAGNALESAPWYPARRGDVVLVHYPAAGDFPAFGETYVVDDADHGMKVLKFVAHSAPLTDDEQDGYIGCFAVEAVDCPLYELWFEAGPHLLTIVRDGRPVHIGGAR